MLIADDEGGFRETLTKILQHKDVVVSQAVNAEQTLIRCNMLSRT